MALSKGQLTRQKMINLMYLVFIAMLALNVSTEVLDGFVVINDNLKESITIAEERNRKIYADLEASNLSNAEKTQESYNRALSVKAGADSIFNYIRDLKQEIADKTDGSGADVDNLRKKDDIGASSEVMMSLTGGQGKEFKKMLDQYRERMVVQISDPAKRNVVERALSTEPSERARKDRKTWLEASFDRMPSIAAITLLTELQANIRQTEGEVLNSIAQDIDIKDLRVNELSAFVVPQSSMVMRGTTYRANIILAAVDTTQRPRIVIDGKELSQDKNGLYEVVAGAPNTYKFNGFIELMDRQGNPLRRNFTQEYTVMEPMATIAPLLMDVVYAGIDNEISISVPGVATRDVAARSTNGGTLNSKSGAIWVARPSPSSIGGKFTIVVSATVNGVNQQIASKDFRIRALPDPLAYIEYKDDKGNTRTFRRGALARGVLLNSPGIQASIDDGILKIPFTVLGFRTMSVDAMGNVTQELSSGANFSSRQIEQMRRMTRGTQFFITGIKVKGPDGQERDIYSMDIRIN